MLRKWKKKKSKESSVQTKFILHGHDDLHLVETVQAQILHEVRSDLKLTEKHEESGTEKTNAEDYKFPCGFPDGSTALFSDYVTSGGSTQGFHGNEGVTGY